MANWIAFNDDEVCIYGTYDCIVVRYELMYELIINTPSQSMEAGVIDTDCCIGLSILSERELVSRRCAGARWLNGVRGRSDVAGGVYTRSGMRAW